MRGFGVKSQRCLIVVLVVLVACATAAPDRLFVRGADYEGVIFSDSYARRTFYRHAQLWSPTRKIISEFEKRCRAYLDETHHPMRSKLASRKRQYLGWMDEATGRKVLRVRFYCANQDWQTKPLSMADGADCNCSAEFDMLSEAVRFGCAGH